MQRDRVLNRLCHFSTIGGSAVPGVPLIEIVADQRVLIENHQGIYLYSREQICIQTKCGMIRVDGKGLFLETISKEQLTIIGKINGVSLCQGEEYAD